LSQDLGGGQIALQARVAGAAKPAAHGASHLTRHALSQLVFFWNEHCLNGAPIAEEHLELARIISGP